LVEFTVAIPLNQREGKERVVYRSFLEFSLQLSFFQEKESCINPQVYQTPSSTGVYGPEIQGRASSLLLFVILPFDRQRPVPFHQKEDKGYQNAERQPEFRIGLENLPWQVHVKNGYQQNGNLEKAGRPGLRTDGDHYSTYNVYKDDQVSRQAYSQRSDQSGSCHHPGKGVQVQCEFDPLPKEDQP
jgi:hypothetical protein